MRNVTCNMTPLPACHQQKAFLYPFLASLLQPLISKQRKAGEAVASFRAKS